MNIFSQFQLINHNQYNIFPQDPDDPKLSTLHRTINALRCRLNYKNSTELEKKTTASQNKQSQSSITTDGISSLLSFDPSLPSYYRVNIFHFS